MFENKVLRRIFGPRRDEVTGEWRRLHNEELNDLYCSLLDQRAMNPSFVAEVCVSAVGSQGCMSQVSRYQ